jgi:hypothetical protein
MRMWHELWDHMTISQHACYNSGGEIPKRSKIASYAVFTTPTLMTPETEATTTTPPVSYPITFAFAHLVFL